MGRASVKRQPKSEARLKASRRTKDRRDRVDALQAAMVELRARYGLSSRKKKTRVKAISNPQSKKRRAISAMKPVIRARLKREVKKLTNTTAAERNVERRHAKRRAAFAAKQEAIRVQKKKDDRDLIKHQNQARVRLQRKALKEAAEMSSSSDSSDDSSDSSDSE